MKIYIGTAGTPAGKGSVTGSGKGIYTLEWNEGADLRITGLLKADNASMVTVSPDGKFLYSVNETKDFGGINGSGGGITACRIAEDGSLHKINDSLSYGSRPAYVSLAEGRYLAVANHGSHSTVTCHYVKDADGTWRLKRGFDDAGVALFERKEDGSVGRLLDLKVFEGHGYWCHGGGQSTSHVHCTAAKGSMIAACDRGADRIYFLKIESGKLNVRSIVKSGPGMAPRYAVFHPDRNLLYVLNENYPCLAVYDADRGICLRTVGTMDAEYENVHSIPHFAKREADENEHNDSAMGDRSLAMPADLHITRDGKFLYASNRYHAGASIAVFRLDENGLPVKEQVVRFEGKDLRGFGISDDGRWLAAGLLDENRVEIRELDERNGMIGPCIAGCHVPSPSCIVFENRKMR